jgi:hypothetical protein
MRKLKVSLPFLLRKVETAVEKRIKQNAWSTQAKTFDKSAIREVAAPAKYSTRNTVTVGNTSSQMKTAGPINAVSHS